MIVLYTLDNHFVVKADKYFEVYRNEGVAVVRCAIIGYPGKEGMRRAIAECERREVDPRWNKNLQKN